MERDAGWRRKRRSIPSPGGSGGGGGAERRGFGQKSRQIIQSETKRSVWPESNIWLLTTLKTSHALQSAVLHCFKYTQTHTKNVLFNLVRLRSARSRDGPGVGTAVRGSVRLGSDYQPAVSSPVRCCSTTSSSSSREVGKANRGVIGMQRRRKWSGGYSEGLCASVQDARH